MKKCFVTKLNGRTGNPSLLKIGEFRIHVTSVTNPSEKTQGFTFQFLKDTTLEIVGDGYFTDKSLSSNLGKTMSITANNEDNISVGGTKVYVSNGNFDIAVNEKYSLKALLLYAAQVPSTNEIANKSFSIDDLKFSSRLRTLGCSSPSVSGDISALSNKVQLQTVDLSNTAITGDISAFTGLPELHSLNLSNTAIVGYVSAFSNCPLLNTLVLSNTNVSGDYSFVKNLTKLSILNMTNTNVSGDISAFTGVSSLTYISAPNTSGDLSSLTGKSGLYQFNFINSKVTGDLANLSSILDFANFGDGGQAVLSWSSRPSSAKIIAINGQNVTITQMDKMLQDQANCTVSNRVNDPLFKTIRVKGTRTSASDAAVQTLQSKGYTVSITPA